jgi:hypothetical protein
MTRFASVSHKANQFTKFTMPPLNLKSGISIAGQASDRSTNFTGRAWVFLKLQQWLSDPKPSRYFLLTGEPGAGKTAISDRLSQFSHSPEPLHPNLLPNFLSAIHYCSARDSTTVDPKNFAKKIALQLAQQIPQFAQALKDIGEKQVNIQVDMNIGAAHNSTIQAIVIQTLNLSGMMTAQEALNSIVLNPLHTIYEKGFDQPIAILVDALDEALTHAGDRTIVDLLSSLEHLPPQVRFILTSRKVVQVENKFLDVEELNLSASEFNSHNQTDLHAYIQTRFAQNLELSTHPSELEAHQREAAIDQIAQKSEGNFLYVRFLLDEIDRGKRSPTNLDGLPEGLDSLYYESLERAVKLGKRDWLTTYAPIFEILSVARSSLTLAHLQNFTGQTESTLWQYLGDLREFFEEIETQTTSDPEISYRLYHQSIIDFLGKRSLQLGKNTRHNAYYISIVDSHKCIANHYWPTLAAIRWQSLDNYAYHHLAHHLWESDRQDDLFALLTTSSQWMEAKFIPCNGDVSYVAELDFAINSFSDPLSSSQLLVLIQLHTALLAANQRINRHDDIDLRTLVWLGKETQALSYARLRTNPHEKFQGIFEIHYLLEKRGQSRSSLLDEIKDIAYSIEDSIPRVSTLSAVAHTLAQANRQEEAEIIFAEVEKIARSLEKDEDRAWSLALLATSLFKANQNERSNNLFSESRNTAITLSADSDRLWVLKSIAGTLIEVMDLDAAAEIIEHIHNHKMYIEASSELATALVRANRETQAEEIFAKLETLAHSLDYDFDRGQALEALASALAKSKYFVEAERIASTIDLDWGKTGALATLSAELAQVGEFSEAERIAKTIENKEGQAFVLRVLALVHARNGNSTTAIDYFQKAGAIAPIIEDPKIPVFALAILAITLKKADREAQAQQIFQEVLTTARSINEGNIRSSVLRAIALNLAQDRFFSESELFANDIEDPLERAWALKEIAIELARCDFQTEALKIFTEVAALADLVKNNQHQDRVLRHKNWVLEELSKALTQVGYFAEAEKIARMIQSDSWKSSWALRELVKALSTHHNFAEAERIARAIPETDWQRVEAFCAISVSLADSGDNTTATSLLREAKQLAESIDAPGKSSALRALVTAFIKIKQLFEAEEITYSIEDIETQAWALQELAIASEDPDRFTQARNAIDKIDSGFERFPLLLNLANKMAQLEQSNKADELFIAAERSLQDIALREQSYLLQELASDNARLGRFSESRRIIENIDSWMERDRALQLLIEEVTKVGQLLTARDLIQTITDKTAQRQAYGYLAFALMKQDRFEEALNELKTQTPDEFIRMLASCDSIFDRFEAGLSLGILDRVVQIIGWIRPDWRKISSICSN